MVSYPRNGSNTQAVHCFRINGGFEQMANLYNIKNYLYCVNIYEYNTKTVFVIFNWVHWHKIIACIYC